MGRVYRPETFRTSRRLQLHELFFGRDQRALPGGALVAPAPLLMRAFVRLTEQAPCPTVLRASPFVVSHASPRAPAPRARS